ncbi:MAG: Ribonuclease HI [Alphaproteobacteria bacterium MarineAlpha2_Bin1]|nr:MAG: Ribonuclease HI [Alphaproteobacteria bacterium MarineAlpha2_Bin1]|tara:strand:+ start:782 stop:1225 length:444 start_codon:yes stop_codon:yes gene_type:complete
MDKIKIYTDGACSGNPGPGGWGAVIIFENNVNEIFGFEEDTTNNRMELVAVIKSLQCLDSEGEIEIYTDSTYVMQGITKWINSWKKNNWLNASKKQVKNEDLWKKLDTLSSEKNINWIWVKGHSGNKWNDKADHLARNAIKVKMSGL